MSRQSPSPPVHIIMDTQEQLPYGFEWVAPAPTITHSKLDTGDYSLAGLESTITIERKSLPDLYRTCGKAGRARFEREMQRMASYRFAAVVIEAEWSEIICRPPHRSKLNPASLYASLIAWATRYNVQVWPCINREFAEKTTYRILERIWRDRQS